MRSSPRSFAVACVLAVLLAAPVFAHVVLRSSTPAAGDVLDVPPPHITVVFSGRIEPRYSELRLFAPDGAELELGPIMFADDSDREFSALAPPLTVPGSYTVRWRTAGADGHVLQGSFGFVLAGDTTMADLPAAPDPAAHPVVHHEEVVETGSALLPASGRWLQFVALTLLVGGVAFRLILLPGLSGGDDVRADLRRRTWRVVAAATLLLAFSAMLRLWLQSRALHGPEDAWDSVLLSLMLRDTAWGRAWMLQAFGLVILGAAILLAAAGRDRQALGPLLLATVAVSTVPALSGHAAGAAGNPVLAVINDTLHVLAAGGWLGTLAVIAAAGLPAMAGYATNMADDVAALIHRFSPIALGAAGLVVLTGVLNTLMHVSDAGQLTGTEYGRTLLLKVGVVVLVAAVGFYNWRVVRPRLGTLDATRRLRISMAVELTLALIVLGLTAVLTGLHRP